MARRYALENNITKVNGLGQSIWYDNISKEMILSGDMKRLIDIGVSGLTSNPTIFFKAITGSESYDEQLNKLASQGLDVEAIYEELVLDDIRAVADLLKPTYDKTNGADGYVSLEVNPNLAHETNKTIEEATRLFEIVNKKNLMIKVPATPSGIPAIRTLIGKGINVNVTLIFSLQAYSQVRQAYLSGLKDFELMGGDLSTVASVASFFVSRVDTLVDKKLSQNKQTDSNGIKNLLGKAAITNARLAYNDFKNDFYSEKFIEYKQKKARVQRPLWASTGTKNPEYSDVLYPNSLIGNDTVNTMPDDTLESFLDHGWVTNSLDEDRNQLEKYFNQLNSYGIKIDDITKELLEDGVKQFVDSYNELIRAIEAKCLQITL